MSLRFRLVLGLVAVLVAGLAAFGIATYSLYAPSQYARLDDQLKSSLGYVTAQLYEQAGIHSEPPGSGAGAGGDGAPGDQDDMGGGDTDGGPGGGPPATQALPPGTFSELVNSSGKVLASTQYLGSGTLRPELPRPLPSVPPAGRFLTTGATTGAGGWQVLLSPASGVPGDVIVIAVSTSGVTAALHRLLLIEAAVAAGLLAILTLASWLVLRRGLRPLEDMATTARSIAAGDLSRRVGPAGGPSEVAQLGQALDTMLADIEKAFAERATNEQRLRRFLADASHELRTPLTSIQGFAELFRLGVDSEHIDQATIVRRIEDEAARMRTLVEDLLLLARLDLAPEPQHDRLDLAVLAADACSDAVALAPDRPVTLDAPGPVDVTGDVNHLRQAIANLVTNAIAHTPSGSPIEVSARRQNGTAVVSVRDHGPGLDAEGLEHVFDRFWQANAARSGSGAGLGLSIVSAIAAEHGGRAEASNAEGGGAMFSLRIPAIEPAGDAGVAADAGEAGEAPRQNGGARRPGSEGDGS
ncbi:MAG TPA: HAMP domain-containing sensor histidine kinase [Acidimicrobiales bacterium]|nr:HAMP domain-containing sensor histidine kinase [Acidimicrobiales bacterium]